MEMRQRQHKALMRRILASERWVSAFMVTFSQPLAQERLFERRARKLLADVQLHHDFAKTSSPVSTAIDGLA
jgi:hypothetical protein